MLVKPGDTVDFETPLVTLETDKATMDVPSTAAGVVEKVHVAKGGKLSPGARGGHGEGRRRGGRRGTGGSRAAPRRQQAAPAAASRPAAPQACSSRCPARGGLPAIDEASFGTAHAGPSVRNSRASWASTLGSVSGSGFKGRITHDDVKAFVKQVLTGGVALAAPAPALPQAHNSTSRRSARSRSSRSPASRRSPAAAAGELGQHPARHAVRRGGHHRARRRARHAQGEGRGGRHQAHAARVHRARRVRAHARVPDVQRLLDEAGENLVFKKYIHIGFAADTPNGLVVPVIHDADKMDILRARAALGELGGKARAGKLPGAEMQGGCFTISSLGGIGGTAFTPIINAPEVAILGVSNRAMKPVWDGKRSCRA